MTRPCKDCYAEVIAGTMTERQMIARPAPHPGPRCVTHHRRITKARKKAGRDARILKTYGMTPEEYDQLKAFQGGVCYICETVTGATKALAIEHDHKSLLWRGLACGPDNWLLAKLGDDPVRFERIAEALRNPPAVQLFGMRYVPGEAKG
jgi:hypothetical protein